MKGNSITNFWNPKGVMAPHFKGAPFLVYESNIHHGYNSLSILSISIS